MKNIIVLLLFAFGMIAFSAGSDPPGIDQKDLIELSDMITFDQAEQIPSPQAPAAMFCMLPNYTPGDPEVFRWHGAEINIILGKTVSPAATYNDPDYTGCLS